MLAYLHLTEFRPRGDLAWLYIASYEASRFSQTLGVAIIRKEIFSQPDESTGERKRCDWGDEAKENALPARKQRMLQYLICALIS
jgi:hypothetical protein